MMGGYFGVVGLVWMGVCVYDFIMVSFLIIDLFVVLLGFLWEVVSYGYVVINFFVLVDLLGFRFVIDV